MQQSHLYFVGIDGGGTRCRAKLFDQQGQCFGSGESGGANVASNFDQARKTLLDVVKSAVESARLEHEIELKDLHVAAGLAGANLPSARSALEDWSHPFASFNFTSDLFTAIIGAHAGNEGALLIVGTGSCAASWHNKSLKQYGGHGLTLGDKGSGAWMGKQAVVHTLESLDSVSLETKLSQALCNHLQLHVAEKIVDRFNLAPPSLFGELAPLVMQLAGEGESRALSIVREGATYLSIIARKALMNCGGRLALCGGAANAILPYLDDDVQTSIVPFTHSPEWGAVFLFHREQCDLA